MPDELAVEVLQKDMSIVRANPNHFVDRLLSVLKVLQQKAGIHEIERAGPKGQTIGVRLLQMNVWRRSVRSREAIARQVYGRNACLWIHRTHCRSKAARATSDIED